MLKSQNYDFFNSKFPYHVHIRKTNEKSDILRVSNQYAGHNRL